MEKKHIKAMNMVLMTAALGGGMVPYPSRRKTYRNGPCEKCGKPNVRRGRETGVYLCEPCFNS